MTPGYKYGILIGAGSVSEGYCYGTQAETGRETGLGYLDRFSDKPLGHGLVWIGDASLPFDAWPVGFGWKQGNGEPVRLDSICG